MNEYKRLTNKNIDEFNPEYDFCIGCEYFGEPNGCNRQGGSCGNYDQFNELYNRLAELEDKIENGTLVELPCKVGDTAYELFIHHRPPFIKESTIEKIIIKPEGLRIKLSRNAMYETSISSLGKTIFLTREGAEKALAETNIE